MGYGAWFEKHGAKHKETVDKLLKKGMEKEEIIDYFDFDNMVKNEPSFCPLYKKNQKCHDMEELNCYLCACPGFRFSDDGIAEKNGKTQMSGCAVHSKNGKLTESKGKLHQDCSGCIVPHRREYIEKHFDLDWFRVMRWCKV